MQNALTQPPFLPMSAAELQELGWAEIDILLLSGDAYVDHPSFAMALLGRSLISAGFRVGLICQPPWKEEAEALEAIIRLGRPRLFAGVSAGAIDSMLAHYTAFRKKRHDDAYTPGGVAGARPNRASLVYTGLLRRVFPGLPVILGGIEASLRRISHYDFWSSSLRRSILLDSKADALVCGMGEETICRLAPAAEEALSYARESGAVYQQIFRKKMLSIPGLALPLSPAEAKEYEAAADIPPLILPGHEEIERDHKLLIQATGLLEKQVHQGKQAALQSSGGRVILLNPPAAPPRTEELDALYALPYARLPHPSYREAIPAWEMIRTSITSHRGCAGGCAFCTLALHQGRRIASRSRESILTEAARIANPVRSGKIPNWCSAISDVGGPSANMWGASCKADTASCGRASCLWPDICPSFCVDQRAGAELLRAVAAQTGVRHVRVASGLRFDLALRDPEALAAYAMEFTGGQLKIAPEHSAENVLGIMRKPSLKIFERFLEAFTRLSIRAGKEQYVIPYLMSAHPGCSDEDMRELSAWLRKRGWKPQQVQCFIPTPGSMSTAMFYAGVDERGRSITVAKTDAERLRQHYLLAGERKDAGKSSGGKKPRASMRR